MKFGTNDTLALTLDTSQNATFAGNVATPQIDIDDWVIKDNVISTDTADGSDNKEVYICAGGAAGDDRGAYIDMTGNDYGSWGGLINIIAGQGTYGGIKMTTGGVARFTLTSGGATTFAGNVSLDNGGANGANLSLMSEGYTAWEMDNVNGGFRLFRTGGLVGLALDASYNATFVGNVTVGKGKYLIGENDDDGARINLIGENGSDDIAIGEYNGNKLDNIRFHTKSSQNTLILDDSGDATFAGELSIPQSKKLYLDGGGAGDTYLWSNGSNQVDLNVGGTKVLQWTAANFSVEAGNATFAGEISATSATFTNITGNGLLTLTNASTAIKMVDSDVSGLHHSFASGSDAGLEIDADLGDVANNSFIKLRVDDSTGITLNDRGSTSLTPGNDQTGLTVTRLNTSGNLVEFKYSTTSVGQILTDQSGISLTSASDYRLKENITDMTGGVDRLKQLKPKRFSFKSNPESTMIDGFLAHEVMDIVPQAVAGLKDEIDENDDPKYQGMDNSKLVPLLVQAVKELSARIEELESK
jgi:hypothetical protein